MINYSKNTILKEIEGQSSEAIADIISNLRKRNNKLSTSEDLLRKKVGELRKELKELEDEMRINDKSDELIKANYNVVHLEGVNQSLKSYIKKLESEKKDLIDRVQHLEDENKVLGETGKQLEELKSEMSKIKVCVPPPKAHKMGTEEFYRDLIKCAKLVEIKVDKNGRQYESWVNVLKALKKEQTVMNYLESYGVKLTRDNVKRWLRVAQGDGSVNVKEYNQARGYKK